MKKSWLFLLASALTVGWIGAGEAAVIRVDGPNIMVTNRQPIEVIIVDSNGNIYRQMVYYEPAIGGINLDTSWAGPNASIYFPSLGTRYIWYNGYWVDDQGYYWDGTRRVYINYPNWRNYWGGYWQRHRYANWDNQWRGKDNRNWRRDGWRRDGWRGRDNDGWRQTDGRGDDDQGGWRRDGWRGRDNDGWRQTDGRGDDDQGGWRRDGWRGKDNEGWQSRGTMPGGSPDNRSFNTRRGRGVEDGQSGTMPVDGSGSERSAARYGRSFEAGQSGSMRTEEGPGGRKFNSSPRSGPRNN